jgi:hypothetical protein
MEPGLAGPRLTALGRELPKPRAVLIVSPHWMTPSPQVGMVERPRTIHDFGGFDPALYEIDYPVAGHPQLARRTLDLLQEAGWSPRPDERRGLDHGAWVPMLYLYPEADVPVFQVSLPARLDADSAWAFGQALAPLADDGVLIVGSGSLTHNLYEVPRRLPYRHRFGAAKPSSGQRFLRASISRRMRSISSRFACGPPQRIGFCAAAPCAASRAAPAALALRPDVVPRVPAHAPRRARQRSALAAGQARLEEKAVDDLRNRLRPSPVVQPGKLVDQRQVERRTDWRPGLLVALAPTDREVGIELVPALADALEQRPVVRVVAVDFVARKDAGKMLAPVAFRTDDIGRQMLPGVENGLRLEGAVGAALAVGEAGLEEDP